MPVTLSPNEIHARAAKFAELYKNAVREEAEAQSFQTDFLNVLGIDRRRVAIFEKKVKCMDGGNGYIDLFWPGHILIEMKSRGKDRAKAYEQARLWRACFFIYRFLPGKGLSDHPQIRTYQKNQRNTPVEIRFIR